MSLEITHVHFASAYRAHQTIVRLRWRNTVDGESGESDCPALVDLTDSGESACVCVHGRELPVVVVRERGMTPYLRARDGDGWSNELVNRPAF